MNLREITPCIGCSRNCHPIRLNENDSAKAAAFLLIKAVEEEGSSAANVEAYKADADEIERTCESRYTTKRALSAIASCGTRIGAGECEAWQLDSSQPKIIAK